MFNLHRGKLNLHRVRIDLYRVRTNHAWGSDEIERGRDVLRSAVVFLL
jgi:hypothetical protein